MQDASSKQQTTKIQTQSLADRITTSLSLAHQRKNTQTTTAAATIVTTATTKLSANLTMYEANTNHWTDLRKAETKRKKEFSLLQGKNSTFLEA